jgi:hypothetical protein
LDFARAYDRVAAYLDAGEARGYFERAGLLEEWMRSNAGSEPLDLGRIVTTAEDVRALRRARAHGLARTEDLLRALAALPPPTRDELRRRQGPSGAEPFRL